MTTQPPSFEPKRNNKRPSADGARSVGGESTDRSNQEAARRARANRQAGASGAAGAADRTAGASPFTRGRPNAPIRKPIRQRMTDAEGAARPAAAAASAGNTQQPSAQREAARPTVRGQQQPTQRAPQQGATRRPVAPASAPERSAGPHTMVADVAGPSAVGNQNRAPQAGGPSGPKGPNGPTGPNGTQGPLIPEGSPRKKRSRKKKIIASVAIFLVLVIGLPLGWGLYLLSYGNGKVGHVEALSGRADTPGTTYLIVGTDRQIGEGIGSQRSDTMMLLQIPESGEPALVSLPRDSYVEIPGYGGNKLNAAFSFGGAELLVQTVEELTGLTVDHYVQIGMGGVKDLVDAVGGVNLCYDQDVSDSWSGMEWTAGCHDVNGTQALSFSRMRKADPLGDIGRTARQRQVVAKIIDKVISKDVFLSPSKQKKLMGAAADVLTIENGASLMSVAKAGMALRTVMGSGGLMGPPPISSLNYHPGGVGSTVQLDPETIDQFWVDLRDGKLTKDSFASF